jgi:predicted nucleic acid-binding protein
MARCRRIVPDNSVLIPAFFNERLSRPARRLADAIRLREVTAFAPEILIHEFMKVGWGKTVDLGETEVAVRLDDFLDTLLPNITMVPGAELAQDVMRLRGKGIHVPDSWYAACALRYGAELWVSHAAKDRLVERARLAGINVRILRQWK